MTLSTGLPMTSSWFVNGVFWLVNSSINRSADGDDRAKMSLPFFNIVRSVLNQWKFGNAWIFIRRFSPKRMRIRPCLLSDPSFRVFRFSAARWKPIIRWLFVFRIEKRAGCFSINSARVMGRLQCYSNEIMWIVHEYIEWVFSKRAFPFSSDGFGSISSHELAFPRK